MVDVFKDEKFAMHYEQVNLNLDDVYGQFANTLIALMGLNDDSRVLEIGSGSGISASKLFTANKSTTLVGVDKSKPLLDIARLRFGQADNLDSYLEVIAKENYYPKIIGEFVEIMDLADHLKMQRAEYSKFGERIELHQKEAHEIDGISEEPFDYVFTSQVFHWLRKYDGGTAENPNLDYEREVLQKVRDNLKPGGLFAFNTTGWDFGFDVEFRNDIHLSNHPFYKAFRKYIDEQISKLTKKEGEEAPQPAQETGRIYTLTNDEVERITAENGFKVVDKKYTTIEFEPNRIVEFCLIGGHMQIFQKEGIEATMEEREEILRDAVRYASERTSPELTPVVETGVHYVVENK